MVTHSIWRRGTIFGTFIGEARIYRADGSCLVYDSVTEGTFSAVQPEWLLPLLVARRLQLAELLLKA